MSFFLLLHFQSLRSRGYVQEQFSWQHYYWYLTNEGKKVYFVWYNLDHYSMTHKELTVIDCIRCLKTDSWNHFFLDQVSHTCENISTFLQRSSLQHFADRPGLKLQDPDQKVGCFIIGVWFSGGAIIIILEPLVQLQSNLDYQTYPTNTKSTKEQSLYSCFFPEIFAYKDEDPGKHWNLPMKWSSVPTFQRSIKDLAFICTFACTLSDTLIPKLLFLFFVFFFFSELSFIDRMR